MVGGAQMLPIQGILIDQRTIGWLPAVNFSFILPFVSLLWRYTGTDPLKYTQI